MYNYVYTSHKYAYACNFNVRSKRIVNHYAFKTLAFLSFAF